MSAKLPSKSKPSVGWREWVSLPDLGIRWIKAKIDTGARSSCIHAFDVRIFEHRGVEKVRFSVHPMQRDSEMIVVTEAEVIEHRHVRSSTGHRSLRPVIEAEVVILGEHVIAEVTLANRDEMGFRMLLGREAVRGRFLVDPGRSFLGVKPPSKKRQKKRRKKSTAAKKAKKTERRTPRRAQTPGRRRRAEEEE